MNNNNLSTAYALVALERDRQIAEEGYTAQIDDTYKKGQLANLACCYLLDPMGGDASTIIETLKPKDWKLKLSCNENTEDNLNGRIRDLTKGAALAMAEIDRLIRLKERKWIVGA